VGCHTSRLRAPVILSEAQRSRRTYISFFCEKGGKPRNSTVLFMRSGAQHKTACHPERSVAQSKDLLLFCVCFCTCSCRCKPRQPAGSRRHAVFNPGTTPSIRQKKINPRGEAALQPRPHAGPPGKTADLRLDSPKALKGASRGKSADATALIMTDPITAC